MKGTKERVRKKQLQEPLDFAYFIKKSPSVATLLNNHAIVEKRLTQLGMKKHNIVSDLSYLGQHFFDMKYRGSR